MRPEAWNGRGEGGNPEQSGCSQLARRHLPGEGRVPVMDEVEPGVCVWYYIGHEGRSAWVLLLHPPLTERYSASPSTVCADALHGHVAWLLQKIRNAALRSAASCSSACECHAHWMRVLWGLKDILGDTRVLTELGRTRYWRMRPAKPPTLSRQAPMLLLKERIALSRG